MTGGVESFLEAAIRTATPLAVAALGEMVVERSGVINIGLEGCIIAGALGAVWGASIGGVSAGWIGAMIGGLAMGILFVVFVIAMRSDQIIAGTAVTLFALGVTGFLNRVVFGSTGVALTIPTSAPVSVPILSDVPIVGALFRQSVVTYLVICAVPLLWWFLGRTSAGLALRAVGENPAAAEAAGISPARVRIRAILVGSVLGGISGGALVLTQVGTFAEGMSAGRGFIAIAIVALGRWSPIGVAGSALLFGAASALQYLFQTMGWNAPYQLFLALPYVVTLVALAGAAGRARPPAALARRMT